jgi:hypothetical protein
MQKSSSRACSVSKHASRLRAHEEHKYGCPQSWKVHTILLFWCSDINKVQSQIPNKASDPQSIVLLEQNQHNNKENIVLGMYLIQNIKYINTKYITSTRLASTIVLGMYLMQNIKYINTKYITSTLIGAYV